MAFEIDPQPGEQVFVQREFRGSHSHIFAMAVSNQALYLSAQKWALKDDWYFKRVSLDDVKDSLSEKAKTADAIAYVDGNGCGRRLRFDHHADEHLRSHAPTASVR